MSVSSCTEQSFRGGMRARADKAADFKSTWSKCTDYLTTVLIDMDENMYILQ